MRLKFQKCWLCLSIARRVYQKGSYSTIMFTVPGVWRAKELSHVFDAFRGGRVTTRNLGRVRACDYESDR